MKAGWALLFFVSNYLYSTVAVVHDIKTMTRKSGVVIDAEVLDQKVLLDPKGRIITLSTLRVKEGLKGAKAGQEFVLYQVGGEYQGRVMRLQGASVYRPGERVVLFASKYKDKIVSYGLGLGKFNIVKNQVIEDIHDLEVLKKRVGLDYYEKPTPRKYRSLEKFKAEIREAL